MHYREGQKAAIIGFGITGQATARFLLSRGATVSVFEGKEKENFSDEIITRIQGRGGVLHFKQDFSNGIKETEFDPEDYDFVVISPGISPVSPLFQDITSHNVKICNDLTLFIEEWREIGPIVGVTGSNGKSTVVSLLYDSLKKHQSCILGGNIGNSPLDMLDVEYEKGTVAILEISSSQLELFREKHYLDICLLMNLSSNHLDRYDGDMNLYAEAKMKGVDAKKTKIILCADDVGIQQFVFPVLKKKKIKKPIMVSLENNSNDILPDGFDFGRCNLYGTHNLYNIAFVVQIMNALGISFEDYKDSLEEFKGLAHRIEMVKEVNGVMYINDSKSTSPQAIGVALETLGKEKNITLIAGGDDKDMEFKDLEPLFHLYVKNLIILPGAIAPKLEKISDSVIMYNVENMQEAVTKAHSLTTMSDIVLLSPGAGSHTWYKGFDDRGEKFRDAVMGL